MLPLEFPSAVSSDAEDSPLRGTALGSLEPVYGLVEPAREVADKEVSPSVGFSHSNF